MKRRKQRVRQRRGELLHIDGPVIIRVNRRSTLVIESQDGTSIRLDRISGRAPKPAAGTSRKPPAAG